MKRIKGRASDPFHPLIPLLTLPTISWIEDPQSDITEVDVALQTERSAERVSTELDELSRRSPEDEAN